MEWLENNPIVRLSSLAGVALGLLTGAGTIVGWIASESFLETGFTAVRVAGLAYLTIGLVAFIAVALTPEADLSLRGRLATVVFAGVTLLMLLYFGLIRWEDPWFFFGMGCLGIAFAIAFVVSWTSRQRAAFKAARIECPDCAETVKSRARVCRYCGYRFQPPPPERAAGDG